MPFGPEAWRAFPFQPGRLKEARQFRALSKGALRIIMRGAPVGSWEHGTRVPTFSQIIELSCALGMPVGFFTKAMPPEALSGPIFFCGRGRERKPKCRWCDRKGTHLCDGTKPTGKSCDAPMCTHCRTRIGPENDLCPTCAGRDRKLELDLGVPRQPAARAPRVPKALAALREKFAER